MITNWNLEKTHAAYKQGWGLFYRDDKTYAIQKLDDPENTCLELFEEEFKGKHFESDEEAIAYVRGSECEVCKLAIKWHDKNL